MTQDELWLKKYYEVMDFIETNKNLRRIRGTGLYTNIHNIVPQESLSKCSLN